MRASPWRSLHAGLFGLSVLALVGSARAQGPAPAPPAPSAPPAAGAAAHAADAAQAGPSAPVITPPVVKRNDGAAFPKQALDEGVFDAAEVHLLLDIGPTGAVSRAVVDKPAGHGFDEAAVEAAKSLEFEPARRDGQPIAVRIGFLYRFTPPTAALSGSVVTMAGSRPVVGASVTVRDPAGSERTATTGADGSWRIDGLPRGTYHVVLSSPGLVTHEADEQLKPGEEASSVDRLAPEKPPETPGAAASDEVQEVEVKGERPPREVTKHTLEQREINRIPGTGGDALRSLQNLPGVGRPPGFAGLLIIRGSAPQDTQTFIDGTPVPLIYHFGGLSSVVPTEMIDKIEFVPGNFSSQYGRAMGGIVDVDLLSPKEDKLHALVEANLIDTRLIVQGPIFETGWTFTLAGRRSWVDVWAGPVLQGLGASVTVAPVYYDYQAMLEKRLSKHETFRLSLFGSDDRLALLFNSPNSSEPAISGFSAHTGFWRAQALYKNHLSSETELRVVGAVGQDYIDFSAGPLSFSLTDTPITSRVELAQKLDPRVTMNVGFDVEYAPYTLSAVLPPPPKPGQPPPGPFSAQQTRSTSLSASFYEPAFYTEFEATPWPGTRIVPGVRLDYTGDTKGWDLSPRVVVRQDVARDPRTTLKGGVGIFTQPPSPQETNATFGMSGLSSNRSTHYDLGVEHEFTKNIEASLDGFYKDLDHLVVQGLGNTGSGSVVGAETLIKYKPDERFFGWLSYTLSRSVRRDAPGMPERIFLYDETHLLTVLGSYRLGRGWEFGARYRLTSGYMSTPQNYGFYDENIGTYVPLQSYPPNGSRLPLFHSLDLRVDKTWHTWWGQFGLYLDVINTYNNANPAGISSDYNFTHHTYANDLPFLPSLGFRVEM